MQNARDRRGDDDEVDGFRQRRSPLRLSWGTRSAERRSISTAVEAQTANRVFELRTYTAPPGKLEALKTRFRDHTTRLFTKHGMTNIGYWQPIDPPLSENTLTYILAYPEP